MKETNIEFDFKEFIVILITFLILSGVLLLLWNHGLTSIFLGLPYINYGQSMILIMVSNILFNRRHQ